MRRISYLVAGVAVAGVAAGPGVAIAGVAAGPGMAVAGVAAGPALGAGAPQIEVVEMAGVLDRPLTRYALERLDEAEAGGSRLIVFQVDSIGAVKIADDGGLPELVERVRDAKIPVAVHIGPRRAHAGGAALFLAQAAGIASIGPSGRVYDPLPMDAAHPGELTRQKEAFLSLATARGRAPVLGDSAPAFPLGANDARANGYVDLVVPSLQELFARIDGREVDTSAGRVRLDLPEEEVTVRFHQPGPLRRALHALADPALLYLLILGVAMLAVFEAFQQGFGVAGGTAVLLALLAAYGLTVVPVTLAGGALLAGGLGLLAFDVFRNELTWPTWLGVVALLAGSVTWLPGGQDALRTSPWLAVTGALSAFIFFAPVMTYVRRASLPRTVPSEVRDALIGGAGMVRSVLNPEGYVMLEGELWRARTADGNRVRVGEQVIVSSVEGATLIVQLGPSAN